MSTYSYDSNKAVRRATVCLRCPEEHQYQGPRFRVIIHILLKHVEIIQVPYYCLLCGYKTTKESQLKAHPAFHQQHIKQREEAIAARTFEGDNFYFRKSEQPYQPKPEEDYKLMSTKGTQQDPISCSSGEAPLQSDAELASSESSSILPDFRFGQLPSPQDFTVPVECQHYGPVPEPMEVVQEVLEQASTQLLTDSDLDSSFSFLRSQPTSQLVSTPSLATPVREVMLRERQDDEDILQQLLPVAIPLEINLTHPTSEWDHILLRQQSKSPSLPRKSFSSSSSSTCHHLENIQEIISTGNCGLTVEGVRFRTSSVTVPTS
ncbi:unnamed protein product [Mytilus edulis]|uniref:C2H2-type domain-containing protein n=1 Tax=Mytilus edulis TaxID=6550 RepID=A0A8S3QA77_MYTED|nr:unnamed protein product [Mytilus edulis]